MFKALPNTKRTLSKCPKLFNIMSKWRNFAKSGPTDEELTFKMKSIEAKQIYLPTVRSDNGIKSSPILSHSCPKSSHVRVYFKSYFFKIAQKLVKYLGHFCNKMAAKIFQELPNLVTLLTTNPNERKQRSEQHRNDVKNYDVRVASGKRC